jgi:hypothetical protein
MMRLVSRKVGELMHPRQHSRATQACPDSHGALEVGVMLRLRGSHLMPGSRGEAAAGPFLTDLHRAHDQSTRAGVLHHVSRNVFRLVSLAHGLRERFHECLLASVALAANGPF